VARVASGGAGKSAQLAVRETAPVSAPLSDSASLDRERRCGRQSAKQRMTTIGE
jgi:hypothetical protein